MSVGAKCGTASGPNLTAPPPEVTQVKDAHPGNLFHAPDWFVEGLPDVPLDGELWIGRKMFQRTVGVVRRQDKTDLWRDVKFLVFDAPAAVGGFEERVAFVKDA